jgi:hypothetical protein
MPAITDANREWWVVVARDGAHVRIAIGTAGV